MLRLISILFLLCISSVTLADEIKCFSGSKIIYSGRGEDIAYTDEGLLVFKETKSGKDILIAADCIIKMNA